jgi:hypothetical protein
MKLYVGARNYKPVGYKTLDIDAKYQPDILADVTDLMCIQNDSCDEICASHILEHLSWPDSFKALHEFSRVLKNDGILKIAVPDVMSLLQHIQGNDAPFWAMGLLYGVGGRENSLEIHRYGFTQKMLIDILDFLGFSRFEWWNSKHGDGSNGWIPLSSFVRCGISLNIQAIKVKSPTVDPLKVFDILVADPMISFSHAIAKARYISIDNYNDSYEEVSASNINIYQDIHYKLIEANQRITYLESLSEKKDD